MRRHRGPSPVAAAVAIALALGPAAASGDTTLRVIAPKVSPSRAVAVTTARPLALRFALGAPLADDTRAALRVVGLGRSAVLSVRRLPSGPTVRKGLKVGKATDIDVTALVRSGGTVTLRLGRGAGSVRLAGASRRPVLRVVTTTIPPIDPPPPRPDTSPPTAPGALTSVPTRGSLALSWVAAGDDRGVTGYSVTVNGGAAVPVTATNYTAAALTCETTYTVDVRARDAAGNVGPPVSGQFATSPCPVLAAVGDIACSPPTATTCRQQPVATAVGQALGSSPDNVFVMLGDAQYSDWASGTSNDYTAAFGGLTPRTWPAQGNHDFDLGSGTLAAGLTANNFNTYFASRLLRGPYKAYSVDIGSWHLAVLNSNCSVVTLVESCSAQTAWLQADLAATRQPCIAGAWHHPRWTSPAAVEGVPYQDNPVSAPWFQALYDRGADVVMAGHSHHYERSYPMNPGKVVDAARGLRMFTVGTGGRDLRPPVTPLQSITDPTSQVNGGFGFLRLKLRDTSADYAFVTESGVVLDQGTILCHPKA